LAAFTRSAEQSYLTLRLTGPRSRMFGRRPGLCHRSRASRMLYRLSLTKFEWPSQSRCSALICLTLLRNLSRVRTWSHVRRRSGALILYSHARAIISDCMEPLAVEWKLSEPEIGKVRQAF
jgi:hypothetical protein